MCVCVSIYLYTFNLQAAIYIEVRMAEKKDAGRKTQSKQKLDVNQWILARVKTCFKHIKNDKFKKSFAQEATKVANPRFSY